MRVGLRTGGWVAALVTSQLMLLAGPAASASGAAQVRFVHATLGVESAQLQATEGGITQKVGAAVPFGGVGSYAEVPAGRVSFEAQGADGGSLATMRSRVENGGYYTAVAIGNGTRNLALIRDTKARKGAARLRIVHAAPELGRVDVRAGGRALAERLGYEDVAPYERVDPGSYRLEVARPGNGAPLASASASLSAGTSSTAFVVGSGGEPVKVVVAADRTAAPAGAPATGLGGLAGEDPQLLLALLAALAAGLIGVLGYIAVTGRSRGHGS